ncbi:MAG: histidine kinase [Gordonia sp. (in: high G+C Gram-positive bacteria)]|uniref:sensor histidine kinase n=1 Tax=Gordonia sp. (in: high G+C Gram-positive bacteria) TaxID=84139 RepID=UPI003BB4FBF4
MTLVALGLMLFTVFFREGDGPTAPSAPLLAFTVLGWLPLTVRGRWPLPVLVATVIVAAAQIIIVPLLDPGWDAAVGIAAYQPVPIATTVAAYAVAVRPDGRRWGPGTAAALVLPMVSILVSGTGHLWTALVMSNLILDGTLAGALVAGRRDRIARDAQERLDLAHREVEAERLRIARELHDVLAHHLTLVNAQAGVADYLLRSDPAAAAQALDGMTRHTRQALDELRAIVGLLRHADNPDQDPNAAHLDDSGDIRSADPHADAGATEQTRPPLPTLQRLPELLATVRGAGLHVHLHESGTPAELAPGPDLAAYRIVQEAITNAAKHAPGQPVDVALTWTGHHLRIRVANHVAADAPINTTGSGHGLLGMTERVHSAGGTLRLERPTEVDGDFVVTVNLPTETAPTDSSVTELP